MWCANTRNLAFSSAAAPSNTLCCCRVTSGSSPSDKVVVQDGWSPSVPVGRIDPEDTVD